MIIVRIIMVINSVVLDSNLGSPSVALDVNYGVFLPDASNSDAHTISVTEAENLGFLPCSYFNGLPQLTKCHSPHFTLPH